LAPRQAWLRCASHWSRPEHVQPLFTPHLPSLTQPVPSDHRSLPPTPPASLLLLADRVPDPGGAVAVPYLFHPNRSLPMCFRFGRGKFISFRRIFSLPPYRPARCEYLLPAQSTFRHCSTATHFPGPRRAAALATRQKPPSGARGHTPASTQTTRGGLSFHTGILGRRTGPKDTVVHPCLD